MMHARIISVLFAGLVATVSTISTAPVAAQDRYGAIAIGKWPYKARNAMGGVSDGRSRADAERRAYLRCTLDLVGCRVALWWKNACGAASFNRRNTGWGTGWGPTKLEASARAVASCRSAGNADCSPGTSVYCTANAPEYRRPTTKPRPGSPQD